jgi:GMP synthase (glutamine-hydrolysing)
VLIVQHSPNVPLAYLEQFLKAKNQAYVLLTPYTDQPFPKLDDPNIKAIISLGGVMGAYDEDKFPWLKAEKEWMRDAVARKIPFLGICLGCQMLADALGGSAFKAPKYEVGYGEYSFTKEAATDPVFGRFSSDLKEKNIQPSWLLHHGDTFTLPSEATLLAKTVYPQAFRIGSALGVQFHPEAGMEQVKAWSSGPSQHKYPNAVVTMTREQVLEQATTLAGSAANSTARFFEAWWQSVPPS